MRAACIQTPRKGTQAPVGTLPTPRCVSVDALRGREGRVDLCDKPQDGLTERGGLGLDLEP